MKGISGRTQVNRKQQTIRMTAKTKRQQMLIRTLLVFWAVVQKITNLRRGVKKQRTKVDIYHQYQSNSKVLRLFTIWNVLYSTCLGCWRFFLILLKFRLLLPKKQNISLEYKAVYFSPHMILPWFYTHVETCSTYPCIKDSNNFMVMGYSPILLAEI